jgi:hypothetical protein
MVAALYAVLVLSIYRSKIIETLFASLGERTVNSYHFDHEPNIIPTAD